MYVLKGNILFSPSNSCHFMVYLKWSSQSWQDSEQLGTCVQLHPWRKETALSGEKSVCEYERTFSELVMYNETSKAAGAGQPYLALQTNRILPWASTETELYQHQVFLENLNHERAFFSQARPCPPVTSFLGERRSWPKVNHHMPSWDQLRDGECRNA